MLDGDCADEEGSNAAVDNMVFALLVLCVCVCVASINTIILKFISIYFFLLLCCNFIYLYFADLFSYI